jgi:hypothetical protein
MQLRNAMEARKDDPDDRFMPTIEPPQALVSASGHMYKSDKASLLKHTKAAVPTTEAFVHPLDSRDVFKSNVIVVDIAGPFHRSFGQGRKTFKDGLVSLMQFVLGPWQSAQVAYLLYDAGSVPQKSFEQAARQDGLQSRYTVKELAKYAAWRIGIDEAPPPPQYWQAMLAHRPNRDALWTLLIQFLPIILELAGINVIVVAFGPKIGDLQTHVLPLRGRRLSPDALGTIASTLL